MQYALVHIKTDEDILLLIDFAVAMGSRCCQQLFISTYNVSVPPVEQDEPRVDVMPPDIAVDTVKEMENELPSQIENKDSQIENNGPS